MNFQKRFAQKHVIKNTALLLDLVSPDILIMNSIHPCGRQYGWE